VPKQRLLRLGTFADIVIMLAGLAALTRSEHVGGMFFVLVLMASQATFFSPSKYGSVPDMVAPRNLTRANGILEASRYAAVILGTVLGAVLMEFWRATPALIGMFAVGIAVVEFLCSLAIAPLPATPVTRNCPVWPWSGIGAGISELRKSRSLSLAVASLTFFEMLAALVVMDVLLLARMDLGLGDAQAGSLAGVAAIGSGIGALLSSRLSRPKAELAFAPAAAAGLGVTLLLIASAGSSYAVVVPILVLLGICSGAFFVPFLAWLQKAADRDERGLVLSTNNFMNMFGVLGAATSLWVLSSLELSPRAILGLAALVAFLYAGLVLLRSRLVRTHMLRRLPALRRPSPPRLLTASVIVAPSRFSVPLIARARHARHARAALLLLGLVAFGAALPGNALASEDSRQLTYRIRHERLGEIGSLVQDISVGAESTEVVTRINVHASLFGVPLKRMESHWRESWQDGVLKTFAGTTTADGTTAELRGEAGEGAFLIRKGGETIAAPVDVQPVNPWSLRFTRASVFMSPETGRLTEAAIVDEGMTSVKVNGRMLHLRRYRASFEGDHELYFDDAGMLVQFSYSEFAGRLVITLKTEDAPLALAP
jgi:acyl-[acyl-carrier-protein]-phospholipid O-acyltransferase/long-chain-fatty-acid--[acyl-carrier-protein] ligase